MQTFEKSTPPNRDEIAHLRRRIEELEASLHDCRQQTNILQKNVSRYRQVYGKLPEIEAHDALDKEPWQPDEQRYQTLFDHSINGIILNEVVFDQEGQPVDVILRAANKAFEDQTGLQVDGLLNKKVSENFPQAFRSGSWQEYVPVALTGQAMRIERFSPVTNRYYDISVFCPQSNYYAVTFMDITDYKLAQRALQRSEKRFRTVLENIGLIGLMLDLDGNIIFCNDYLLRLTGWEEEEILNKSWFEVFLPPGTRENLEQEFFNSSADQNSLFVDSRINEIMTKTGERRLIAWHNVPLLGLENNLVGVTSIGEDITSRHQAEESLRQSEARYRALARENARLLEQARHDAQVKAMLLQEVNHRVKNNLMAISGLLMMEQRYIQKEKHSVAGVAIGRLHQRLQGLLETHILLSQTDWGPVPLTELIQRIINVAIRTLSPKRNVRVTTPPAPVKISPRQASNLALVLNELVTNTIKHATQLPVGPVDVNITALVALENNTVRLEYRDDGPGYPSSMLFSAEASSRYSQVDIDARHVGLSLVQRIVTGTLYGSLSLTNDGGAVTVIQFNLEEGHIT